MANEKRLIDANALISNLRTFKGLGAFVAETLVRFVKKQPTVDAAPVTRCKDCRFCEVVDETQRYFCRKPLGAIGYIPVKPDDFCSYGEERKMEEK